VPRGGRAAIATELVRRSEDVASLPRYEEIRMPAFIQNALLFIPQYLLWSVRMLLRPRATIRFYATIDDTKGGTLIAGLFLSLAMIFYILALFSFGSRNWPLVIFSYDKDLFGYVDMRGTIAQLSFISLKNGIDLSDQTAYSAIVFATISIFLIIFPLINYASTDFTTSKTIRYEILGPISLLLSASALILLTIVFSFTFSVSNLALAQKTFDLSLSSYSFITVSLVFAALNYFVMAVCFLLLLNAVATAIVELGVLADLERMFARRTRLRTLSVWSLSTTVIAGALALFEHFSFLPGR
jgi:hypothetical protein